MTPTTNQPPDSAPPDRYLTAQRTADELQLQLYGEWHARQFDAIHGELVGVTLTGVRRATILPGKAVLDLTGAWLLHDFVRRIRELGIQVRFPDGEPQSLHLVERTLTGEMPPEARHVEWLGPSTAVEDIGRQTVRGVRDASAAVEFVGHSTLRLLRGLARPARLRPRSITRHVYDTGITAIPIVSLIAFLVSVILAYLGAQELQQFGANVYVVDLVTIGVLRELGVLLTAIIVAGRSGSAFTAELGSMQLNQEVDALLAIGLDPFELLVVPRIIGLIIALPLLTVIADIIGLAGGGLLVHALLQMPVIEYLGRVRGAIASTTFWVGIVKAPVFAALIALSGCYQGMRVRGSSRDLGERTTVAVVQAIFGVILADALFAVLFLNLNV